MLKEWYSIVNNKINSPQVSFGLILAIVVGAWGFWTWANANFISTAKAEASHNDITELIEDLAAEVSRSNELMLVHMDKHRLDSVAEQIGRIESELFALEQFTRVNGSDRQAEIRYQDLTRRLKELEIRRNCLLDGNPLCD